MTTERKTDKLKVATYHTMASFAILETFVLVHVLISLLVTPDKRLGAFAGNMPILFYLHLLKELSVFCNLLA